MEERKLELRVGILIASAIAGAIALLYLLGQLRFGGGAEVFVDFSNSGGVPDGAAVRVAGVRVGRVSALRLHPDRRDATGRPLPVEFVLEIPDAVLKDLRADSRVVVATQGVLGEPYLEIEPGGESTAPLQPRARLRGVDPARMDLLMSRISEFLDSASALLGREHGLERLVESATHASQQLDLLLTENGPAVSRAANDLQAVAHDLRGLLAEGGEGRQALADLSATLAQVRRDVPAITARAKQAADGIAALTSNFDAEDARRVKEALAQYQRAGESLDRVAVRAERLLAGIEAGQGTLGMLAKDPALYQDIREMVTDLKQHPWKLLWKK